MKEVTMIYATPDYINCPYCNAMQGGWVGNIWGAVEKCDECGETYKISDYADVELS